MSDKTPSDPNPDTTVADAGNAATPDGPAKAPPMAAALATSTANDSARDTARGTTGSAAPRLMGDPTIIISGLVCLLAFGSFLAWGALAPLAEGVVATGRVVVADDRKVVQHLEGGLIEAIHVSEGDQVRAGDVLVSLTSVSALAGRDQIVQRLASLEAGVSRTDALLDGLSQPVLTRPELNELDNADWEEIVRRQTGLFRDQRMAHQAALDLLANRRDGLRTSLDNLASERRVTEDRLARVAEDLALKRQLLDEQLVERDQVAALEREESQLRAEAANLHTRQDEARAALTGVTREMRQTEARFREALSAERLELLEEVSRLTEELGAAQDVVNRTLVIAPQSGKVLNLAFRTVGGVVGPGEPILEIVPEDDTLVALLEILPMDRDNVTPGQVVRARLSGTDTWASAPIEGDVLDVSADLKLSPDGRFSYYEARVTLAARPAGESPPRPGMPVEAFIESGRKRTMFDYLLEPIFATFRRAVRE